MIMSFTENLERVLHAPRHPELRTRLHDKLNIYEERIKKFTERYRVERFGLVVDKDNRLIDSIYKATLLRALLDKGTVRVGDVRDQLQDELKDYASDKAFMNAHA